MNRFLLLLLTIFISVEASALTIICSRLETIEEKTAAVLESYEKADIVLLSSEATSSLGLTTKHTVEKVWKGEVGSEVYVYGNSDWAIIYGIREEENAPLTYISSYCGVTFEEEVEILVANFGAGYEPSQSYPEYPYSQIFLRWPVFFILFSLTIAGYIVYNYALSSMGSSNRNS